MQGRILEGSPKGKALADLILGGREHEPPRSLPPNITIIANNCWAGAAYRALGLPYHSPFIGLFLYAPCYIQLLKNLRYYLESPLTFTTHSRYAEVNQTRQRGQIYPIGLLRREIEIHFAHYATPQEAWDKWTRRTRRIDWSDPDRLFFKFCDRDHCSPEFIVEFDQLRHPHKVCFTSQPYPRLQSVVWIQECQNQSQVVNGWALYSMSQKYFNLSTWLSRNRKPLNSTNPNSYSHTV